MVYVCVMCVWCAYVSVGVRVDMRAVDFSGKMAMVEAHLSPS